VSLVNFLLKPEHYSERPSNITYIETHASHVFIGDHVVYKIKKPVNLGFLDFSTLKKRQAACHQEVLLNSRLAGDVYLGVVPIYQTGQEYGFRKTRGGSIVEYAVRMKRIPDDYILDNLIRQGRPLYGRLEEVGSVLADFHNRTPSYRGRKFGGLEMIRSATQENFEQMSPDRGVTIERPFYDELKRYTECFIEENEQRFLGRRKKGWIKEGHGDLHTQHICLVKPPIIFDCIEFNKSFRIIDVLQDIAFLFMDLEFMGRFDLSARLFKAYSSGLRDCDEEILRFYKVYRAVVRGKVNGLLLHDSKGVDIKMQGLKKATDYFKLAEYYLHQGREHFNPVVIMGLSGSGKSALARDFANGWVILRSDEIRKRLGGVAEGEHAYLDYGKGIYSQGSTDKIYSILLQEAIRNAQEGKRVVVDATYLQSEQRMDFYRSTVESGMNPFFIHCFASEDILRERIKKRMEEGTDVSDAHLDILARQIEDQEEPVELPFFRVLRLNTEDTIHETVNALKEFL